MPTSFDLVVIGSGPGGSRAAIQAAKLGKSVAVVERGESGGACVHTGTIPSKSLREAAIQLGRDGSFPSAVARTREVVEAEARVVHEQLTRNGVQLFRGEASFVTPHEVSVGDARLQGAHFVIATGTSPNRHKEFSCQHPGVYDSDSILGLEELPSSLLVVGAGVIGCEYASIFGRLGANVTLADRRQELLRAVDPEIIAALMREFEAGGVEVKLGSSFGPVLPVSGSTNLAISVGSERRVFDAILVCLGRTPNTASLGLAAAGVQTDERGYITVSRETFATSAPHIHAVGDVIGPPGLAASAAEQGRIAACRIFGEQCPGFPSFFPYGIYTIPEISSVGLLETEIQAKGFPYVVGRAPFRELARGLIAGDRNGFVKLFVHAETRKILGVHAIGLSASELVHIGQVAMALGASVDFLVENVFNYPTLAEAYKVAALNAVNQLK